MQRFNYNGKWISEEEMRKITLKRQGVINDVETSETNLPPKMVENTTSDAQNEPLEAENSENEQSEPKPDRDAIKAELKSLGVEFKGNAKTSDLVELLNNSKTAKEPESSESEQ